MTGCAGVGKSTLVQDVLSNGDYPFFIPYYAFLPDGEGNPRDRGEALTFFQDVIGRLDKFFPDRYSLGITDVAQGREALREHMAKAHEHYVIRAERPFCWWTAWITSLGRLGCRVPFSMSCQDPMKSQRVF